MLRAGQYVQQVAKDVGISQNRQLDGFLLRGGVKMSDWRRFIKVKCDQFLSLSRLLIVIQSHDLLPCTSHAHFESHLFQSLPVHLFSHFIRISPFIREANDSRQLIILCFDMGSRLQALEISARHQPEQDFRFLNRQRVQSQQLLLKSYVHDLAPGVVRVGGLENQSECSGYLLCHCVLSLRYNNITI